MKEKSIHIIKIIRNGYNAIKNPTIITILTLLACYFSIHTLNNQIGLSERVLIYILCYISTQNYSVIKKDITSFFPSILSRIGIFFICLYATFAEIGTYYLDATFHNPVPGIPYFVLSAIWVFPITLFIISKLYKCIIHVNFLPSNGFSIKARILMIFFILALCAFLLIAFNPAITSPDSVYCYHYSFVVGEEYISDGHPGFYIWLLSILVKINPSIQFLIMIQCIYFSVIFVKGINVLAKIGVPKKICLVIYFFVGWGYNTLILLITFWKDIPFMTSLLWLTILIMEMSQNKEYCTKNYGWYVEFFIACLFTSLIRHNGILPAIVTLIFMVIATHCKIRMALTVGLIIVTYLGVKGPIYDYLKIIQMPGQKFYALANDILYVYYSEDDLSPNAIQLVNEITNNDPEGYSYTPYYTSIPVDKMGNYSTSEFLNMYIHTFMSHPQTMLNGILCRNSVIWSIDQPEKELSRRSTCYLNDYHSPTAKEENLVEYPFRKENILTKFFKNLFSKLNSNSLIYMLYWRAGVYHLLILSLLVLIVVTNRTPALLRKILPFFPILVNVIGLFLSSGWPDYRYYWPGMVIGCLLLPYGIIILKKQYSDVSKE